MIVFSDNPRLKMDDMYIAYIKYTEHSFDSYTNLVKPYHYSLKVDLGLAGEDCQHAVTDESLCMVTGCALGTDVCHWMFKTKVNMVQDQEDGPLSLSLK